jgi:hypothetical protein
MNKDKTSRDDPLGIANVPVLKDANDVHATNDPVEVARRGLGRLARLTRL